MIKYLSWLGSLTGIIGALLIATATSMIIGYIFFIISSSSWLIVSYLTNNNSLLVMNIVFTIINMIGLYTYLTI